MASGAAEEFDAFYEENFRALVAQVAVLTLDRREAEDIVQDAFVKAWLAWPRVRDYDLPVAWVRRVAFNGATSRWRRLRRRDRHRPAQPEEAPDVDLTPLMVETALRSLSPAERQALVLYYLVDLSVTDVANEMSTPPGTVKSLLARGRAHLAPLVADSVTPEVSHE